MAAVSISVVNSPGCPSQSKPEKGLSWHTKTSLPPEFNKDSQEADPDVYQKESSSPEVPPLIPGQKLARAATFH
ncbi:hypothetical protein BM1_02418 [Bipolaris maydis]|nr:hypothetical protein BM1_02418 [Bipolaris maydis]KAJ5028274.1 hypothetical protein J3E73DRAFT_368706 [Bipolaris maydis]KAJ6283580.1 hypothetical protein J3E71DRAFT_341301 [Bipolaris maydis]